MSIFESRLFEDVRKEIDKEYKAGTVHLVRVTHINNPQSYYVRPIKYNWLLRELEANLYAGDTKEITALQTILFRPNNPDMQRLIRGQIVSLTTKRNKPITYDVFAMDYGFLEERLTAGQIFHCEDDISLLPPLTLHCQLDMCIPIKKDEGWSSQAITTFKQCYKGDKVKIVVRYNLANNLVVQMFNVSGEDVATMMAAKGASTTGYVLKEPLLTKW